MTTYEEFREQLSVILAESAAQAVANERDHRLPFDTVASLYSLGLGRLRVPVEWGGFGVDYREFARVLVELATADASLTQIFRSHFAFVEHILTVHERTGGEREWLDRIVSGESVGSAWSETANALGGTGTRIEREGDALKVFGRKYYTTGSIYADWADVTATFEGQNVVALVRLGQPGVTVSDDWDGFGQQLTGTGTIEFDGASVDAAEVAPAQTRFSYQTAFYQFTLNATQVGIAKSALRELIELVQHRDRVYSHGLSDRLRDDAQIQQVVGEISAQVFAAESALSGHAEALERSAALEVERGSERQHAAQIETEIVSNQAQTVISRIVPHIATQLFDALGASAVSRAKNLDRHWRNSRTVASHNPVIYKIRLIGQWLLNGTEPIYHWTVGTPGATGGPGSTAPTATTDAAESTASSIR